MSDSDYDTYYVLVDEKIISDWDTLEDAKKAADEHISLWNKNAGEIIIVKMITRRAKLAPKWSKWEK